MVNKPVYVWPFIFVYKSVTFILKIPILFIRFFSLGFFFTCYFFISLVLSTFYYLFKYLFYGISYVGYIVYRVGRYVVLGFMFPFIAIPYHYNTPELKEKRVFEREKREKERLEKAEALKIERERKQALKEEQARLKQEKLEAKKLEKAQQKEEKVQEIVEEIEPPVIEEVPEVEEISTPSVSEEQPDTKLVIETPKSDALLDAEAKEDVYVAPISKTKEEIREEKRQAKLAAIEAKKQAKEEKKQKRLEEIEARKKEKEERKRKKENDSYINENVKIEKKTIADRIEGVLEHFKNLPGKFKKEFEKSYNNLSFVKNKKNQKDISRQALLINFEGADAEKSDKKVVYEYVGKNADGKLVKGYFEAFSKVEVHSFLLSEGFEVYSIKTNKFIQFFHGGSQISKTKIKTKDLIFFLTQLSTYIKAGIPLVDALKILSRQYKDKSYQRIFRAIIYDLTMGDNFSDALNKQGDAFPKLLINMIKVSEMTGELPEALDDMADYYTETDKTRKQMVTAMMYPSIIFIIAIAVITFIMVFVVPRFVEIYASMDNANLPSITQMVISLSAFLESNLVWIFIGIVVFFFIYRYLYKNVKLFRTLMQWIGMHLPAFGNVIIYNEVTMFTKTFASLLRHNVFITDSMEILNKITNNEIYKMIILDTITNLARGEKISLAFKDHWAVPLPAYEMIVTGERTGQLPEMMGKVAAYYQEMHQNAVARIKTFVEPALIVFLTVMVGIIVLSVIIPMFGMYNSMGL